jgi:hypothetical protein
LGKGPDGSVILQSTRSGKVLIGTTATSSALLTVDGAISSSGTVYADSFQSVTGGAAIDFSDNLEVDGYISASGDLDVHHVSASGYYAQDLSFPRDVDRTIGIFLPVDTATKDHGKSLIISASNAIDNEGGNDRDGGDIILIPGVKVNSGNDGRVLVQSDISASGDLYLENGKSVVWDLEGSGHGALIHSNSQFFFNSGSTELMRISGSDGNSFVGIGTQTPPKTLTVEGDISASGTIYGSTASFGHTITAVEHQIQITTRTYVACYG